MYDINMKNVKKGKNFFRIFLIIGIVIFIIIFGIFISVEISFKKLDSSTTSTNVEVTSYINDDGGRMYTPIYSYEVNGEMYTCKSNTSTNIYPDEDKVTVYYDSKNPSKCMTEDSLSFSRIFLLFLILPIIFITIGLVGILKINKRIKKINDLNQYGKLIKNLPYHMENTNMTVNGVPVQRPVVEYTLSTGSVITLYGDPRNDKKSFDEDGMVDLIIDENDPNNYYIDFEINRLTGNTPSDYNQNNIK